MIIVKVTGGIRMHMHVDNIEYHLVPCRETMDLEISSSMLLSNFVIVDPRFCSHGHLVFGNSSVRLATTFYSNSLPNLA